MATNKYIVPGFYAVIEDYQLSTLETAQSLKEDAIIFFGDLPDFVYVPDEKSTDVNAVKRIRITPNTVLPVTNVDDLIKTLTGENILDGILTQEQKDELLCRDMINVIKMSESTALEGKLAVVKIVKRDGTRPDINNKFEVYQALENTYEKLGNVKCSQIVPIGIAGDDDFISGEEKAPVLNITQSDKVGAVHQEHIFNDVYSFSPVQSVSGVKVEFAFEHPEYLNHSVETAESKLIKEKGIDSEEVKYLLTGKVLVNGVEKLSKVQLAFDGDKFISDKEEKVSVISGECNLVLGKGTIFATVKTTDLEGKKVVELSKENKPLLNFYIKQFEIKPEVSTVSIYPTSCKVGEEITVTGKLKESAEEFTATLSGEGFEVTEEVAIQSDKITFIGKVRATAEGTKKLKIEVSEPYAQFVKEFDVTVAAGEAKASVRKKAAKPETRVVATIYSEGPNQYVLIDIAKPTSNWIEVKNLGNLKETVDKIAILEGKKDGVEQYTVTKSGTVVINFKKTGNEYKAVVTDTSELIDPIEYEIKHEQIENNIVVSENTYLEYEGVTFVLYKGLVIEPVTQPETYSVYFDAKSDTVGPSEYVVNYVPAGSEPIMCSLKYVGEQVKTFSEVLMVWGTRPAQSSDPNVVEKHVRKLVNLPKFKRGFKVRTSASKETDYGMFLSVVAGTIKVNGIGGISDFVPSRIIDFEREQGGIGDIKPLTNKVFVETTSNFYTGANVEIKTFVGVKEKSMDAIVLSTKEVLGKTMITLNKEVDTSLFSLDGFEVMISNTDTKDRHGSYAAAEFAIVANKERDRAPIQVDIDGVADFSFSQEALRLLIENKFTVITKNLITGKGTIVDTPLMTRKDSDYQSRSAIGTVLALLNALRKIANEKKGKRFPKKEDKVMLEEDLRNVFIDELQRSNSLITNYQFATDMRFLDTRGFLSVKFRVQDAKKLETIEFSGGLARL